MSERQSPESSDNDLRRVSNPGCEIESRIVPPPLLGELGAALDQTRKSTILLVEDEEVVLKSITEVLQCNGYKVYPAGHGVMALDLCKEILALDLLLVDLVMPGMNGDELARIVKAIFPSARILLMTGYARQFLGGDLSRESDVCLRKPFSAETLLQRVREALEGSVATTIRSD